MSSFASDFGGAKNDRNSQPQISNKFESPNSNDSNEETRGIAIVANYDLEQRTFEFAKQVRAFVKQLPRTICNREDVPQLVRASGSVGANYLEANNALSKKDFRMRIRISRKESRESHYWLRLLDTQGQPPVEKQRHELIKEAEELAKIFGAILKNSE